ncbi:Alpha/Beta hydrolase protein [Leucosporidium creatinivorum]|uniref:Alpha/Beta hydrolase protein n=1 Tax=Leucosporidium creatinivorum TaxID=106004 RepID=A0A1Y2EH70_9BASI|nr:Alpha/Beta hydrolase protein [Leucosporidium creatinivorum]
MTKALDTTGTTPIPANKAHLGLVSGAKPQKMTLLLVLHFLYVFLPHLFITLPISLLWNHLFARWTSPIVQLVGRPVLADGSLYRPQARLLFNRTRAYDLVHASRPFARYRDWVSYVDVKGTTGRWIAPPGTKRSEDEVCLYFVHGDLDTAGKAQLFFLSLAKSLNLKRNVQFSVFCLDYELAPEFKYPSQLIETLAGYHYLVNQMGIAEDKICLAGDSAGGNLATAFLLHLARPNPTIKVPAELGPTPRRPGSAILISPFVNLISHTTSRKTNLPFDFIDDGGAYRAALDYVGVVPERQSVPSFHPVHFFTFPNPSPPSSLVAGKKAFVPGQEGEGLALFDSPYCNPIVCKDESWWKEACPGEGRTMVTWGGNEIFSDDIEELVDILEKSGVAPTALYKPLGAHDWVLSDSFVPLAYRTHSQGPDREKSYALEQVASFLQETAVHGRKEKRTEAQKNTVLDDKKPQREKLRQRKAPEASLNESEVLVERE